MLASDRELPVSGGPEKRAYVRDIFTAIAPTYDRLNRIISLRFDQRWRRYAVTRLGWERQPDGIYLDLCAGTLDFAATLARQPGFRGWVVGADFVAPMLRLGRGKAARVAPVTADALELPFPGCGVRWRDGRMGSAEPGGPRRGARRGGPRAQARRPPGDPRDGAAAPAAIAPAVPVLFPARAAVDRPADLETYDRLYLATRVDLAFPAAGRARAAARGAGIPRRVVQAVHGRRMRAACGDAGRDAGHAQSS